MTTKIQEKLDRIITRFGLEVPISVTASIVAERASTIGEDATLRCLDQLIEIALEEEQGDFDDPDGDESYDLDSGFDPFMGCHSEDC